MISDLAGRCARPECISSRGRRARCAVVHREREGHSAGQCDPAVADDKEDGGAQSGYRREPALASEEEKTGWV